MYCDALVRAFSHAAGNSGCLSRNFLLAEVSVDATARGASFDARARTGYPWAWRVGACGARMTAASTEPDCRAVSDWLGSMLVTVTLSKTPAFFSTIWLKRSRNVPPATATVLPSSSASDEGPSFLATSHGSRP